MGKISLPEVQDTAVNLETRTVQAAATAVDRSYSKQLEAVVGKAAPDRTSPEDANTRTRMVLAARESNHDDFVRQARLFGMDTTATEALWTQCLDAAQKSREREPKMKQLLVAAHTNQVNHTPEVLLERDEQILAAMKRDGIVIVVAHEAIIQMDILMGEAHATNVNGLVKSGAPTSEIQQEAIAATASVDAAVLYAQANEVEQPPNREELRRDIADKMADGLSKEQLADLMGALATILDHSTLNYLGEKYQMQTVSRELIQQNCQSFLDEERRAKNEKDRERLYQEFTARSGDQGTAERLYQYYKTEESEKGRDEVVVAVLADHAVARWYLDNGYPALVIPSKKSPTEIA